MSKEVQNKVTYMIYCVSAFAGHFGSNFKQAYSYLKRFKGFEFLDECYEAEHQLSISDAVSDLSVICHRNGGALVCIIEENMNKETKFLIDNLTKNLVLMVMEEFKYSITESMDVVYNSQLYEKIMDLETGLYYQSAGYNYELLRNELLTGKVA